MHNTLRSLLLPALVLGCGDGPAPPPPPPRDTTAPAVVTLSPAPGATDVPRQSDVRVTFTEPLNWATVAAASFSLTRQLDIVPATYVFEAVTAVLVPVAPLDPLTTFTVTLTSAVRDSAGNRLAADTSWAFSTGPSVIPAGRPEAPPACAPSHCGAPGARAP